MPLTSARTCLIGLLLAASLSACSSQASNTASGGPAAPLPEANAGPARAPADSTAPMVALTRQVIRTSDMTLRAENVSTAAARAQSTARSLGGVVGSADTRSDAQDSGRPTATLVLRVPTSRFDDFLTRIRDLGSVVAESQQATDVTTQVADVDARIRAQRASVVRIETLLGRADSIGDIVAIEGQLATRQADLEGLVAQQRALAGQTELASATLVIVGPSSDTDPPGFLAGLHAGWSALVAALGLGATAAGALLPSALLVLLIAAAAVALVRRTRRRTEAARSTPVQAEP